MAILNDGMVHNGATAQLAKGRSWSTRRPIKRRTKTGRCSTKGRILGGGLYTALAPWASL